MAWWWYGTIPRTRYHIEGMVCLFDGFGVKNKAEAHVNADVFFTVEWIAWIIISV